MESSKAFSEAKKILSEAQTETLTPEDRFNKTIALTALLLKEAQAIQTPFEKKIQAFLAQMMKDPLGKVFTCEMTDQCFRSKDSKRVADQMLFLLNKYGTPNFLSQSQKIQLWLFEKFGSIFPSLFVPLVKKILRKETSRVILPGEKSELTKHLRKRREEKVRVNLNHLGEAILGEKEAHKRLNEYLTDLENPDIEYISIKISAICSQINLLAWEQTLSILIERLKQLYRKSQTNFYLNKDGSKIPKFVNLDMEEYRDLQLTVETFMRALNDPEFHSLSAGIVLQSYLPDSYNIQKQLTEWAKKRVAEGGAPIKIRIVKGANLAMEQVEASIKGWSQAPYPTKSEVDANFKRMLIYGADLQNASAANLGIASHNLFDIAFAMILIAENKISSFVCFEMLEGMADHMRRVVQTLSGDMLLYCPVSTKEEFQNAIAYLIRRLDENTAPENFLRHLFDMQVDSPEWQQQLNQFKQSYELITQVGSTSRRQQNRNQEPFKPALTDPFENEPDTDWSLPQNRTWAEQIIQKYSNKQFDPIPITLDGDQIITTEQGVGFDPSLPNKQLYNYSLATAEQINQALTLSKKAEKDWSDISLKARSKILSEIAQQMRLHRNHLIGVMMADTGKTIPEADTEISEAIDFAEYYLRNANDVFSFLKDIRWTPKGTILVAPPWNFPCSIPAGGILAALITGNCVIFKPASEAILVGWELVNLFWQAGVPKDVLQFITCEDEPIGSLLIKDERIDAVILTGATATAKLFFKLRPGLDLAAETGGKNAMIITRMSDRDLAVKDLVQSAFGYAGQKCSACSLAICESEVYHDPQFRAQLIDAVTSWKVGSQWDPATRLTPLIHEPNPTLLKGLTSLEKGEEWLVKPEQNRENPNLWSPGVKIGTKPGSFSYQNELFGPVLCVMEAESLADAVKIANETPYGLTAGLHSLDEREHKYWIDHIQAGNCYINRGITGAIVQRQPFGGFKESSFGLGSKAGGPNYLMQFMHPQQFSLPITPLRSAIPEPLQHLASFVESTQLTVWNASLQSYLFFWQYYFSQKHDNSNVKGEDNELIYKPYPLVILRLHAEDEKLNVLRIIAAAFICNTPLEISGERTSLMAELSTAEWLPHFPNLKIIKESDKRFIERIQKNKIKRVRFLSLPQQILQNLLANSATNVIINNQLANGRVELLNYLREVSLSFDYHRYGNLGERELKLEQQKNAEKQGSSCCSSSCKTNKGCCQSC